ncbi:MAG: helix-hairpin-helix domain-containing protein, partial [Ruminococcus sp.]|nr:helix-hairpin-helix domain-containing protein [Ruminococcus sp.]
MAENELIKIEGVVDSVLFCNEQNGYIVLELDTGGKPVTVVGELGSIDEGEELRVTGKYVTHPKFGEQFRGEVCERKMPATVNAIRKYLSSGAIKGIGPTMANRLVDEFGEHTLEVMEKNPRELAKVKGMSAEKAEEVSREFQRIFGVRTLMIFLTGFGISPSVAVSAWKKWGQFSVEMIKANPYVLCMAELDFVKAEQMAQKMEIPPDSYGRVSAGIIYILETNARNGHTCLPMDKLVNAAVAFLGVDESVIGDSITSAAEEEKIVVYNKNGRDFVFLTEYFTAEQYIASRLSVMNDCVKDTGTDYMALIQKEETA